MQFRRILSARRFWRFFGDGFEVPGHILAVLTFASACTGALMITSAAVLAAELHRLYVLGWFMASAIAFGMLLLPAPVEVRVCLALLLGPLGGGLVQTFGLRITHHKARHAEDSIFGGDRINTMPKLTALVTVYHRIDPAQFRACLDSLSAQTRPAEDVVIVEDGPLGPQLRAIVEQFINTYSGARSVVLARNMGADRIGGWPGHDQHGVYGAPGMRTTSQRPERFERQLVIF